MSSSIVLLGYMASDDKQFFKALGVCLSRNYVKNKVSVTQDKIEGGDGDVGWRVESISPIIDFSFCYQN